MKQPNALLSCAQMAEADRLTVLSGIGAFALMDAAGRAVAQAITQRYTPRAAVVLTGPGNNGGDGFVVARCLGQAGWKVRVAMLNATPPAAGEAAQHAALWQGDSVALNPAALAGAELVVDAIFGAGLSRALDGEAARTLQAAAAQKLPIVAVDVPSGLMGDSGLGAGVGVGVGVGVGEGTSAVACALTVTFFRKKPGHVLQPGRSLCGEVVVADIGTPESVWEHIQPQSFENAPSLWRHALPALHPQGHKYSRGHALIVGGYPTTGAARLAARAAARAGAGLTTVAVPEVAFAVYATALTSVMVAPLATQSAMADLANLLGDARFTGLLIGPGAGLHASTREQVLALLATGRPTVLDADALTVFKNAPGDLFNAVHAAGGHCTLTPHEGEFARLFSGDDFTSASKVDRARAAAQLSGAVIVLKGSDTVIAAPTLRGSPEDTELSTKLSTQLSTELRTDPSTDPSADQNACQSADEGADPVAMPTEVHTIINTNAPPTLATAGSGDVLAGLITGLLAQGMPPFLAAAAAVWMHGAAATAFGPGLIAEDLPDLLPEVMRDLGRNLGHGSRQA